VRHPRSVPVVDRVCGGRGLVLSGRFATPSIGALVDRACGGRRSRSPPVDVPPAAARGGRARVGKRPSQRSDRGDMDVCAGGGRKRPSQRHDLAAMDVDPDHRRKRPSQPARRVAMDVCLSPHRPARATTLRRSAAHAACFVPELQCVLRPRLRPVGRDARAAGRRRPLRLGEPAGRPRRAGPWSCGRRWVGRRQRECCGHPRLRRWLASRRPVPRRACTRDHRRTRPSQPANRPAVDACLSTRGGEVAAACCSAAECAA